MNGANFKCVKPSVRGSQLAVSLLCDDEAGVGSLGISVLVRL